jgi:hypothetical protein
MSWTKIRKYVEKYQNKILRWRGRIAIFGLISTIKIAKVAKEGFGLVSSYKGPPFFLAPTIIIMLKKTPYNRIFSHKIEEVHKFATISLYVEGQTNMIFLYQIVCDIFWVMLLTINVLSMLLATTKVNKELEKLNIIIDKN